MELKNKTILYKQLKSPFEFQDNIIQEGTVSDVSDDGGFIKINGLWHDKNSIQVLTVNKSSESIILNE